MAELTDLAAVEVFVEVVKWQLKLYSYGGNSAEDDGGMKHIVKTRIFTYYQIKVYFIKFILLNKLRFNCVSVAHLSAWLCSDGSDASMGY